MAWAGSSSDVPCVRDPQKWEDPHYRFKAMEECLLCPALDACRETYLPLMAETDTECVVAGVSLFGKYNTGGIVLHKAGGNRLRIDCEKHNFHYSGVGVEKTYHVAAEHSVNLQARGKTSKKIRIPKGENEKNCLMCGTPLNPGRRGKKFCSNRCKLAARKIRLTEAPATATIN